MDSRGNPAMASGDMERTRLANERTYLAWWRTGIAVSGSAVGRVGPGVDRGPDFVAVGAALAAAGLLALVYGARRSPLPRARRRAPRGPRGRPDATPPCPCSPRSALLSASLALVLLAPVGPRCYSTVAGAPTPSARASADACTPSREEHPAERGRHRREHRTARRRPAGSRRSGRERVSPAARGVGARRREAREDSEPRAPPIMNDVLTTPEARPASFGSRRSSRRAAAG